MPLQFTEPFNNITAWTLDGTPANWSTVAGRTGNCAQVTSSGDVLWRAFGADGVSATVGFAFQTSALWDDRTLVTLWGDGYAGGSGAQHVTVSVMANGSLKVLRGNAFGTQLGVSAAGIITANTWLYVELGATLSDTLGTVEVRVNGTAVIGPLTGIDTKGPSVKTVFDTVSLRAFIGGTTTKYDDMYLRNDTTFQGDPTVAPPVVPPSGVVDFILGDWQMRRGDRLPMLGLVMESDTGVPVDLTGAVCWLMLRHQDGGSPLSVTTDVFETRNGWLLLPAFVYDAPNGVVVYDWPQVETESLRVGVLMMMVEANLPGGEKIIAPTDRDARLIIRPLAWPSVAVAGWADTTFTAINAGGEYSTLGSWNTSTPGQVAGP